MTQAEMPTMRTRYRAQVRQEVKHAALAQLAAAGPAGLSVTAIGKQLGVSGPALYRYFASRDELLTELVADAYHDLAQACAAAEAGGVTGRARFEAVARAYRAWALAQPHRYRLLFGPPLPGNDAHEQHLADAAQATMNVLIGALGELEDPAADASPPSASPPSAPPHSAPLPSALPPGSPLAGQLAAWTAARDLDIPPATALRAILSWSRLHGLVSLEIAGNFAAMGIDPDALFQTELARLP
jgi:AcrR family transcriptional regulator